MSPLLKYNRRKDMMKKLMILLLCTLWGSGNAFALDLDQLQIHGFASQGYLRSNHYDYLDAETEEGTVEFNEFGLNVISNLADNLRLGIQFLARDLGDAANDEIKVDWAFGDYRYRNWLGLRVGKFRRTFGLYSQSREIDAARTGVFLPLSVYNENNRVSQQATKGIGVYGTLPGAFEYQVQYGTLDSDFENDMLDSPEMTGAQVDDDSCLFYLVWNTPLDGLKVVGRYDYLGWSSISTQGPTTTESRFDVDSWLVGTEYTYEDVTFAAEYTQINLVINDGQTDMILEYYYGLVTYRFTDWLELGTSYSISYSDKDDKDGDRFAAQGTPRAQAWAKDLAISARFDVNESWIIKVEGHWINGLYGVSGYGEDPSEDGFLGAAKVTFSF
jgi:hypothetical protein